MAFPDKSSRHSHAAAIVASPTALHVAAETNDVAAVKALLRGGIADPNARVEYRNFDDGATALHLAAQKGHLEVALALLESGATPDGRRAVAPLNGMGTASSPSSSSSGSDVSDVSDSELSEYPGEWQADLTPLHLACAGGQTEIVRALLSAGERTDRVASGRRLCGLDLGRGHDVNSGSPVTDPLGGIRLGSMAPFFGAGGERDGGHTPMHLASACGAAGAVRVLVEAGASVHRRAGDCDDTPLHLASAAGQVEVVAALLEAGADVDAEDEIGNTPLHVARDAPTLEFLLAHGANPNLVAMSHYGSGSPLGSYCTLIHRLETDEEGMASATAQVETLLRYGADVNITANTSGHDDKLPAHIQQGGRTATSPILSCAAKNGIPGIVSALLRAGVDPNRRDRDGWAPLHDAAQGNHVEVLRVLLRAGAEKDAATLTGRWTPLHVACRYTSVDCVLELLRWGADLGPTARPLSTPSRQDGDGACRCRRRKNTESFVCGAHGATAASDGPQEDEDGDDDVESGYGKTPAQVIGLKHLATAADTTGGPATNGGSGPSADPSLDEEEQMVVLGDDDEQARDRAANVGERNTIRRALRCEAAWRRRRSVVLLKTHLEKQPPPQRQAEAAAAPTLSLAANNPQLGLLPSNFVGGSGRGEAICTGTLKRTGGTSVRPSTAKSAKAAGGARDGVDDSWLLRRVLEGVSALAAREEALFRQIVMFL
eukprot:g14344.t1